VIEAFHESVLNDLLREHPILDPALDEGEEVAMTRQERVERCVSSIAAHASSPKSSDN
jgi:hypothetical protein